MAVCVCVCAYVDSTCVCVCVCVLRVRQPTFDTVHWGRTQQWSYQHQTSIDKREPIESHHSCYTSPHFTHLLQLDRQTNWPYDQITTKCSFPSVLWHCWLGGRKGIRPVKNVGDGGGGRWLDRMKWHPAGWSVCLPLLISPCTIKSRSSLLAPAHPRKRAIKRLWCSGVVLFPTILLTTLVNQVEQLDRYVCVCVWTITFEINDLWYLACCFTVKFKVRSK